MSDGGKRGIQQPQAGAWAGEQSQSQSAQSRRAARTAEAKRAKQAKHAAPAVVGDERDALLRLDARVAAALEDDLLGRRVGEDRRPHVGARGVAARELGEAFLVMVVGVGVGVGWRCLVVVMFERRARRHRAARCPGLSLLTRILSTLILTLSPQPILLSHPPPPASPPPPLTHPRARRAPRRRPRRPPTRRRTSRRRRRPARRGRAAGPRISRRPPAGARRRRAARRS